eukprot:6212524-Pleurochrysis_carterae.AAC.1
MQAQQDFGDCRAPSPRKDTLSRCRFGCAQEHDSQQLQLMLKDANHIRDVAKGELNKATEAVEEERRQRARVLQARDAAACAGDSAAKTFETSRIHGGVTDQRKG